MILVHKNIVYDLSHARMIVVNTTGIRIYFDCSEPAEVIRLPKKLSEEEQRALAAFLASVKNSDGVTELSKLLRNVRQRLEVQQRARSYGPPLDALQ